MKLYKPRGWFIHDPRVIFARGQYHLFAIQGRHFRNRPKTEKSYAHAVSDDLITWNELPIMVKGGPPGAWDDKLATGGICEKDGKFYMLYTGRCSREGYRADRLGLAISDDLITWEKHPANPILPPDPQYYEADYDDSPDYGRISWRDPGLYYDEESGFMYAFITARVNFGPGTQRGCVGLARSKDMVEWECLPPVYHPQQSLCVEVPDVIKVGQKFVMVMRISGEVPELGSYSAAICSDSLTSWDRQAVMSRLEERQEWNFGDEALWGPWRGGVDASPACFNAKAGDDAHFVHMTFEPAIGPRKIYSGRVSLPKKMLVENDDRVKLKIHEAFVPDVNCTVGKQEVNLAHGWSWKGETLVPGEGTLLVRKTDDTALSVDIECDGTASASITVGLNRRFTRGMLYTLEAKGNRFTVTEIESGDVFRQIELDVEDGRNRVSLVLCDLHTEMYFNDQFMGTTVFRKLYSLNSPRYLGLAARGKVRFSNLRIKDLPWDHTYIRKPA